MPAHVLVLNGARGIGPWVRDALTEAGFTCVLLMDQGEARRSVDTQWPALVILPVEELESWVPLLGRLTGGPTGVPVLGVVSRNASVDLTRGLSLGVTDLLTYPCEPGDLVERVRTSMRGRRTPRADRPEPTSTIATLRAATEAAEVAMVRTEAAAARVARAEERDHLYMARTGLAHSLQVILGTMIGSAEAGGPGRAGHARRVAVIARDLAQALGWPAARAQGMELAGLFHDIGLLVLPGDLLAVPGALDERTLELLRGHPDTSADILEPLSRVGLPVAAVRAHHERLDGSGYPRGLRGRQVPVGAQVLAVADTYAALVQRRPHRPAHSSAQALGVLDEEVAAGRLAAKVVATMHELVGEEGGADRSVHQALNLTEPVVDPQQGEPDSPARTLSILARAAFGGLTLVI